MKENSMREETVRLDYRLPVTVARFSGEVVRTLDKLKPLGQRRTVTRTAKVDVDVRADSRTYCSLIVKDPDLAKLTTTLQLLEDGRLTGAQSAYDSVRGERLKAILSAAVAVGAATVPLLAGGPAGAFGLAAATAAATLTAGTTSMMLLSESNANPEALTELVEKALEEASRKEHAKESRPTPEQLGIHKEFRNDYPVEYQLLYRYRLALLAASYKHAVVAEQAYMRPNDAAAELRDLDRILRSIRNETARLDEVYELWSASKRTVESFHYDHQLSIDELPNEKQLLKEFEERAREHSDAEPWWKVATTLGLMLSWDPEADPQPGEFLNRSDPPRVTFTSEDGTVLYRQPLPATLKTWQIKRDETSPSGWKPIVQRIDWVLVTHPVDTRAVRLPLRGSSDAKVEFTFATSGALTRVTSDMTGQQAERVETLAGLPAALQAASKAGSDFATAFSTPAARAAALKQQVDAAEAKRTLKGLLDPKPDRLADLRQQLNEAELQARLALAERIVQDPSSVVVALSGQPTLDG
jgi:hypothetical protein